MTDNMTDNMNDNTNNKFQKVYRKDNRKEYRSRGVKQFENKMFRPVLGNVYEENVQNVQNVNNNLSQNNYNFELKDFIENNYSHSHIPRNAIQNKDFYLHKNFLNLIMENDENKNIYFDGKYAFIYTDGGLKRIQSDKAGYLVLEKLDKAIISYVYSNPKIFHMLTGIIVL